MGCTQSAPDTASASSAGTSEKYEEPPLVNQEEAQLDCAPKSRPAAKTNSWVMASGNDPDSIDGARDHASPVRRDSSPGAYETSEVTSIIDGEDNNEREAAGQPPPLPSSPSFRGRTSLIPVGVGNGSPTKSIRRRNTEPLHFSSGLRYEAADSEAAADKHHAPPAPAADEEESQSTLNNCDDVQLEDVDGEACAQPSFVQQLATRNLRRSHTESSSRLVQFLRNRDDDDI